VHVIQCADYAGPYAGSFVPMLVAAASEAARRGYGTTVCLSDIARDRAWLSELDSIAEVRFMPRSAGNGAGVLASARALRSLLAATPGPVVVHTHFSRFDIPAVFACTGQRDAAVLWHEHTPLDNAPGARLRNAIRYSTLGPLVDCILCVNPEIRSGLHSRGAPARKLRDFPNAIDLRRFTPITAPQRHAARRALGLAADGRVVLHFGWSWHRKGGDLMLAAAETLATEPGLVVLTVTGEDSPAARLSNQVQHPVVRRVAPTNDVTALYAAADVFLSASRAEGMPFAVLEALASGLPVVATDLPMLEGLLSGLPGAFTVAAEPDAIGAGIRQALSLTDRELAEHAELVGARLRSSFSLDAWATRLVDIYEVALQRD